MSPLRQRMVEAMRVRGLSVRTIECYTESISRLSRHHGGTNPARLTPQQIEAYLLHLVQDRKLSYSSVNHAASACRFLFETVLGRPNELRHLRPPMAKVPQRQPELLSRQEISRLFEACPHPGHRMLLQTLYAGGLRISEACQLQVGDIDSNPDRMMLRVRAGKGGADRYTLLSPSLLAALRTHCLTYRCHKQSPGWLFAPSTHRRAREQRAHAAHLPTRPPQSRHHEDGQHPHPAPLLCHPLARRWGGSVHHQPLARPRPHQHHHALPAPDQPPVQTHPRRGPTGLAGNAAAVLNPRRQHQQRTPIQAPWANPPWPMCCACTGRTI